MNLSNGSWVQIMSLEEAEVTGTSIQQGWNSFVLNETVYAQVVTDDASPPPSVHAKPVLQYCLPSTALQHLEPFPERLAQFSCC
eukprot:3107091-Amphidinium_carterae.1